MGFGSNGKRLLMEVPLLGISSIGCFDHEVSSVDQVKVSSRCHCCYNIEWSFNIETELFVEFSLSWFSLPFINIDDIPLLIDSSMSVVNNDVSIFSIYISLDVKYLSFIVPNEMSLESEDLPPS
jgi:hypothetical protein